MEIVVSQPNFWWRIDSEHLHELVPSDPDLDDGSQRHPDRDSQRWDYIAAAVAGVSEALAAGDWIPDPDPGWEWRSTVEIAGAGLSKTEQKIVQAWFSRAESVRMDPWSTPLQNGRHRLWGTRRFFKGIPVPIKGDSLGYANPDDMEQLGDAGIKNFNAEVASLKAVTWFNANDPVNRRFTANLVAAAGGNYPAQT